MARESIIHGTCDGYTKTQIETLARFMSFKEQLPEMYATKIGQLRDKFDIDLRNEIKDSPLWSTDAKEFLTQHCKVAVLILDRQRVKPKPYEASKLQDITEVVNEMEKMMFDEVMDGVAECVCAHTSEICYPEKEEKVYS